MRLGPTAGSVRQRPDILSALLRDKLPQILFALLLSLVAAASTLAIPLLVRELIEALTREEGITRILLWMVPLALSGALASSLSGYLLARAGEQFILQLRARVMEHTLRMPLQTVRAAGAGNLVARITSDAMLLRSVVDAGAVQIPVAVLTGLATIVLMAMIDWVLVLITFAAFALAGCAIWYVLRRVRKGYEAIQIATGGLAQRFTTALTSLLTVKAYRAERRTAESLTQDAAGITRTMLHASRLQSVVLPIMSLGQEIALASIVIVGSARITGGALALPDFIAFLLYLLQLVSPLTIMVMGFGKLQTGLAAKGRFEELLAVPVEPAEAPRREKAVEPVAADSPDAVRFDRVSFAYDGMPVLKEVSFRVPRHGLTAVVGHSGAGKSTLLGLIEGFMKETGGTLSVLGREVSQWPLPHLRARLGYVDQAFTLLEATIRENLLLGFEPDEEDSVSGGDDWLMSALESVDLAETVRSLPDGLDTMLGRDTDLSGGQRQRLALARALLSPADIILLDEPTSQLDALNELRLRDVIDTLARDRAVLVVAHRMSTVMHSDHVVVLKDGSVAGTGTHADLIKTNAHYRDLVESQQWATEEPAAPAALPA
ncbi:ABC transporter ATP-binding protein [Streptomyces sp. NRRL F-5650]|uniref:ABC transporter ATP-binding protein n=1 Tax=Streptomyces sp. NRRL F-5650 TaxID=1463868 RepID=UPI000689BCBA|nr:ABC transporter ATP-binding protein [Streptomyces sp. NRRL F-5650]